MMEGVCGCCGTAFAVSIRPSASSNPGVSKYVKNMRPFCTRTFDTTRVSPCPRLKDMSSVCDTVATTKFTDSKYGWPLDCPCELMHFPVFYQWTTSNMYKLSCRHKWRHRNSLIENGEMHELQLKGSREHPFSIPDAGLEEVFAR